MQDLQRTEDITKERVEVRIKEEGEKGERERASVAGPTEGFGAASKEFRYVLLFPRLQERLKSRNR